MKKRIFILLAVFVCLFACVFAVSISAENEPTLEIKAYNLTYGNSVYISYAISSENIPEGAKVQLLVWDKPQEEYIKGTELASSYTNGTTAKVGGVEYPVFVFNKIIARQMATDFYAVAYVKTADGEYYSAPTKYSVLQYVYNKLGYTGTASNDEVYKVLLTKTLEYGAAAQRYFAKEDTRLADATFYQVVVNGGTLSDGFNKGLYLEGETVTLAAPAVDKNGTPFSYWEDSTGASVSTDRNFELTVGAKHETYTAVYENASQGLAFVPNGDGTCYLSGIGTCTDREIVVPAFSPEGDEVVSVGKNAFMSRRTFTSIEFPSTLTEIGYSSFAWCTTLKTVIIPEGVTTIGECAFQGCTQLTDFTIPSTVTSIGNSAFVSCRGLTSIEIPAGVESIGANTFYYCSGLTSITLHEGLKSIGEYAFYYCGNIIEITIPDSVTHVYDYAFYSCEQTTSLTLGQGLEYIGEFGFYYLPNLQSLVLPDSLKTIKRNAFAKLYTVTSVNIPANLTDIEAAPFVCSDSLIEITVDENNPAFTVIDGNLYSKDGKKLVQYLKSKKEAIVIIPDTVEAIGSQAFEECYLQYISIPESVKVIENNAFQYANYLNSVSIPGSVSVIGDHAFMSCDNLKTVKISEGVTKIGQNAFWYCSNLENVTLPETLTEISPYAFMYCNISYIRIPDSVTKIGYYAFANCSSLKTAVIPESVTEIENGVFSGCSLLKRVVLYDTLTKIGDSAFGDCISLTDVYYTGSYDLWNEITIGTNNSSLSYANFTYEILPAPDYNLEFTSNGDGTCYVSGIGSSTNTIIRIPLTSPYGEKVIGIGDSAFSGNKNIQSIFLSDNITYIGKSAFANCTSLDIVEFNNGLVEIKDGAFFGCSLISHVLIPESVYSIGKYVFEACSSMSSVELSDGLLIIEDRAFSSCEALKYITLPETLEYIGDYAFRNCISLTNINIPASVYHIGINVFNLCSNLSSIEVDASNEVYSSNNGSLYSKDGTLLIKYVRTNYEYSFTIPDGVLYIGEFAFANCTSITEVILPEGLEVIGAYAFTGCSYLAKINIPKSTYEIGNYAFADCKRLLSIEIPSNLKYIGYAAFAYCESLTEITLPTNLFCIAENVFAYCSKIKTIYILAPIDSIGDGAFLNCESLTDVYYAYSEKEWNALTIGEFNGYLLAANIHYDYKAEGEKV